MSPNQWQQPRNCIVVRKKFTKRYSYNAKKSKLLQKGLERNMRKYNFRQRRGKEVRR